MRTNSDAGPARSRPHASLLLILALAGCGGPSARELKNRQEFEMLLTAIALKNPEELAKDARRIDERRAAGELSETPYKVLREIIDLAASGDWTAAETKAYAFREERPYFR